MRKEKLKNFEGLLQLIGGGDKFDPVNKKIKGGPVGVLNLIMNCDKQIKGLEGVAGTLAKKTLAKLKKLRKILLDLLKSFLLIMEKDTGLFFLEWAKQLALRGVSKQENDVLSFVITQIKTVVYEDVPKKKIEKEVKDISPKDRPQHILMLIKKLEKLADELRGEDDGLVDEILAMIRRMRRMLRDFFWRKQTKQLNFRHRKLQEETRKFAENIRERLNVFRQKLRPKKKP